MLLNNLFKYWTYQIFTPGTVVRAKYEAFKSLLEVDKQAHEQWLNWKKLTTGNYR